MYRTPTARGTIIWRSLLGALIAVAAASSNAAAQARDQLDLSKVIIYNSPADIASWPATAAVSQITMSRPAGISISFTKYDSWPDYTPPGWSGPLEYTVWALVKISGQWYGSGFIQMWRGRPSTGAPILDIPTSCGATDPTNRLRKNNFACNWAYDGRWGTMAGYQPVVAEQMGFFVSAGNARGVSTVTSVRERSNVVLVNLPVNDTGTFTFPTTWPSMDFNGDGMPDLVWRNYHTGANSLWTMSGITKIGTTPLPAVPDANYQLVASADFNGDTVPDLVWRNVVTGQNVLWLMSGANIVASIALPVVPDGNWQLVAAADMNRDGSPDLVWRNGKTGISVVWLMRGGTMVGAVQLPSVPDRNWHLVAAGDMNGDGNTDLIWRNYGSGANIIWYMSGTTLVSAGSFLAQPDIAWRIVAALDDNGDGKADLVWWNATTGAMQVWYMNDFQVIGADNLPDADPGFTPLHALLQPGVKDINGDTRPDIVWRNPVTGANIVWYMNGGTQIGAASLPSLSGAEWQLAATADMDGDGKPDLIWRNTTTGDNAVWFMDGTALARSAALPAVPVLTWKLITAVDVNGDGTPDLIWRNQGPGGANVVWYMRGTTIIGTASLPDVPDLNFQLAGAGDMNGDGMPDFIWRNPVSGGVIIWMMNGTKIIDAVSLPTVTDPNWQLVQALDMDGDGYTDLVVRNYSTGANEIWFMKGTSMLGKATLPAVTDTNWQAAR
jgi:hypothetical protein